MAITDILGGPVKALIEQGWKIADQFITTPQEKLQWEQEKLRQQLVLDTALREHEAKILDIAGQNIRAEATSDDKFTKRARPSFIYIVNFIILWNYVVVPLFRQNPLELPEALFWLFGSAILGYTGARSWEKYTKVKNGN